MEKTIELPKTVTKFDTINHGDNLPLKFEGEDYGDGPKDTRVTIQSGTLLWISWEDGEKFVEEFKALTDKYAI